MKLKIFTLHDSKAQAYLRPFFMPKTAMAIRTFTEIANDKNHEVGKHPSDYTLFEIGTYDEETADITLLEPRQALGNGIDFISSSIEEDQMSLPIHLRKQAS